MQFGLAKQMFYVSRQWLRFPGAQSRDSSTVLWLHLDQLEDHVFHPSLSPSGPAVPSKQRTRII
jgi:hypothetical protein